jgi:hypothetical protein
MAKKIIDKNFPVDEFINIDGKILIQDKDYPAVYEEEEGNSPTYAVAKLFDFLGIDKFYNFGLYGMEVEEDDELAFERMLQDFKESGGAFRLNYLKGGINYRMEGKVFRKNGKWVVQAVIVPEFEEIDG